MRCAGCSSRGTPRCSRARVDAITAAFPAALASTGDAAFGGEAIFIASLPRSGSTLVEQILASHPDVEGAGEIEDLRGRHRGRIGAARSRVAGLRRGNGCAGTGIGSASAISNAPRVFRAERPRYTDKSLSNWLYLGAAAAMLPGARFVHCRRDPVETALSCYRQWFNRGQAWSYALNDIVAYWRAHERLMQIWKARLPGRIFTLDHEALLAEPEATMRALGRTSSVCRSTRAASNSTATSAASGPRARPRCASPSRGTRNAPRVTAHCSIRCAAPSPTPDQGDRVAFETPSFDPFAHARPRCAARAFTSVKTGPRRAFVRLHAAVFFLVRCGIQHELRSLKKEGRLHSNPGPTALAKSSSKVVANLVRTLLRSPRCTAHHQLMGSSEAHAQEHDSDWYCGGPFDTSIRHDDERRCGRQIQTSEVQPEHLAPAAAFRFPAPLAERRRCPL